MFHVEHSPVALEPHEAHYLGWGNLRHGTPHVEVWSLDREGGSPSTRRPIPGTDRIAGHASPGGLQAASVGMIAVTKWALTAVLGRASTWILLGLLAVFEPLTHNLKPFGIATYAHGSRAAMEVAFGGALIGTLSVLQVFQNDGSVFRATGAVQRGCARGLALVVAAAPFSAAALAAPVVAGRLGSPTDVLVQSLPVLVCIHLHLAGIALLVLTIPASLRVRRAFLVSFAWVLPILFLSSEGEAGFIATLFGASLHAMREDHAAVPPAPALASIAALWWLAILLSSPRSERTR